MGFFKAVLGLLRLMSGVGVLPAAAAPPGETPTPAAAPQVDALGEAEMAKQYGVSPAELEDLRFFAKQEGVPVGQMIARFGGVSQFTTAVDHLQRGIPEGFVYAEWTDGEGQIVVRPGYGRQAREAVNENAAKARVVERDLLTETERDALAGQVIAALPQGESHGAMVHVDPYGQGIDVDVATDKPSAALSLALAKARQNGEAVGLQLLVSFTPAAVEPTARGGLAYSTCTGGFIVKQSASWGVSSAYHCTSTPAHYDGSVTGTTAVQYNRDVRATRLTTGTHSNSFQQDWYQYRSVTSAASPVVGGPVCKFGLTTGKSCDVVTSSGTCVTYDNFPQFCGLFKTDDNNLDDGDSGGPWYYGNAARGISSGRSTLFTYDLFSGVSALGLLNWTVYTG